jgi:uncharacterized protein YdcH (DUF465 family)
MNAADTQDIKTHLERAHDAYRELFQQHHELDNRLHELTDKQYLSASEQLEEVTLKKRKLALKDQMERMARQYLTTRVAPA